MRPPLERIALLALCASLAGGAARAADVHQIQQYAQQCGAWRGMVSAKLWQGNQALMQKALHDSFQCWQLASGAPAQWNRSCQGGCWDDKFPALFQLAQQSYQAAMATVKPPPPPPSQPSAKSAANKARIHDAKMQCNYQHGQLVAALRELKTKAPEKADDVAPLFHKAVDALHKCKEAVKAGNLDAPQAMADTVAAVRQLFDAVQPPALPADDNPQSWRALAGQCVADVQGMKTQLEQAVARGAVAPGGLLTKLGNILNGGEAAIADGGRKAYEDCRAAVVAAAQAAKQKGLAALDALVNGLDAATKDKEATDLQACHDQLGTLRDQIEAKLAGYAFPPAQILLDKLGHPPVDPDPAKAIAACKAVLADVKQNIQAVYGKFDQLLAQLDAKLKAGRDAVANALSCEVAVLRRDAKKSAECKKDAIAAFDSMLPRALLLHGGADLPVGDGINIKPGRNYVGMLSGTYGNYTLVVATSAQLLVMAGEPGNDIGLGTTEGESFTFVLHDAAGFDKAMTLLVRALGEPKVVQQIGAYLPLIVQHVPPKLAGELVKLYNVVALTPADLAKGGVTRTHRKACLQGGLEVNPQGSNAGGYGFAGLCGTAITDNVKKSVTFVASLEVNGAVAWGEIAGSVKSAGALSQFSSGTLSVGVSSVQSAALRFDCSCPKCKPQFVATPENFPSAMNVNCPGWSKRNMYMTAQYQLQGQVASLLVQGQLQVSRSATAAEISDALQFKKLKSFFAKPLAGQAQLSLGTQHQFSGNSPDQTVNFDVNLYQPPQTVGTAKFTLVNLRPTGFSWTWDQAALAKWKAKAGLPAVNAASH